MDRKIEHPRKAGNAKDQADAVADRVDNFLGQTVWRLCVLNGYLSSGVLESAASETDGVSAEQRTPLLSGETGPRQPGAPIGRLLLAEAV